MAASYEVEGGKELRRSLKKVEDGLVDLKKVHADVAAVVVDRARSITPVVSGALVSSIRGAGTQREALIRAGGAKVPYANVQEWGWPRRNIPAQPYLRPAAQSTKPEWKELYERRIDELLSKVKGAPGV